MAPLLRKRDKLLFLAHTRTWRRTLHSTENHYLWVELPKPPKCRSNYYKDVWIYLESNLNKKWNLFRAEERQRNCAISSRIFTFSYSSISQIVYCLLEIEFHSYIIGLDFIFTVEYEEIISIRRDSENSTGSEYQIVVLRKNVDSQIFTCKLSCLIMQLFHDHFLYSWGHILCAVSVVNWVSNLCTREVPLR